METGVPASPSGYSAPEPASGLGHSASVLNARGDYNAFRDRLTGKLDKPFLRHCAVRRLFERGRITAERAAELLLCKPTIRRAVVATWTDLAGESAQ